MKRLMKKILTGLIVMLLLALCGSIAALAADVTICVLPQDFAKSLGTFTVTTENAEMGAYKNTALRGLTNRNPDSSVPAQVCIEIPQDGEYVVWGRSRDFDTETGKRNLRIAIEKKTFPHVFGAHGKYEWVWEQAGTATLQKGVITLRVNDISGYYGRLDMILLTTDKSYVPPQENSALDAVVSAYRMKDTGQIPEAMRSFAPNQKCVAGKFYTAFDVEAFAGNTGTWVYDTDAKTRLKGRILKGQTSGKPSETVPATVTVAIPEDGTYYLWVRSRDYIDEQGTRTFHVAMDGKLIGEPLGTHGIDGWAWEVRETELSKGYHTFALCDTSAFYARADTFLITNDYDFVPGGANTMTAKVLAKCPFRPYEVETGQNSPVPAEPIFTTMQIIGGAPQNAVPIIYNGKYVLLQNPAVVSEKKHVLLPIVEMMEGFGYTVREQGDIVIAQKGSQTILFDPASEFAKINGKKYEMEEAPQQINGIWMIPARFFGNIEHVTVTTAGNHVGITYLIWK